MKTKTRARRESSGSPAIVYKLNPKPIWSNQPTYDFTVVGCGGTGGFVAEGLCRLLYGAAHTQITLVDFDTIEPRNLLRQDFYPGEVGMFKSEALALRLSRQYGRVIHHVTQPFDVQHASNGYIIGCVDNALARQAIAAATPTWWIEAGNGHNWGQVLIGNRDARSLEQGFDKEGNCYYLPKPSVQMPELLVSVNGDLGPDCAEAVIAGDQSPMINQAMANLVLEFVRQLMAGQLTWMQAYIDLDHGVMRTVPARPDIVYEMTKIPVSRLMRKEQSNGRRNYRRTGTGGDNRGGYSGNANNDDNDDER